MRISLVMALMIVPAIASAGLDLSWNDCVRGDGSAGSATSDVSLNCSQPGSDVTVRNLFLQFMVPEYLGQAAAFTGYLTLIDEEQLDRPLGAFWHAERICAGQTQRGVTASDVMPGSCENGGYLDVSGGGSDGWEGMVWLPDDPCMGWIRVIVLLARGDGVPLTPGQRYYLMHLAFTNRNRHASCEDPSSCSHAMSIFFGKLLIESLDRPALELTGPADEMSHCAGIHGGTPIFCSCYWPPWPPPSYPCHPTATMNRTWGSIKALYR